MDKHIDPTRVHNTQFVCHKVEQNWAEFIQDDNAFNYGFTIKRPEGETKWGEPSFSFKLEKEEELIRGEDLQGGIFVMSSLKPVALQKALAAGVGWLVNSGQLSCDDFWDRHGH